MPQHETTEARRRRDEDSNQAAREASWGAMVGAARWSIYTTILGVTAYLTSPLFRSLTPQFKVYLFMCPVTVGSMVEADRKLREFENRVRWQRRMGGNAVQREQ